MAGAAEAWCCSASRKCASADEASAGRARPKATTARARGESTSSAKRVSSSNHAAAVAGRPARIATSSRS